MRGAYHSQVEGLEFGIVILPFPPGTSIINTFTKYPVGGAQSRLSTYLGSTLRYSSGWLRLFSEQYYGEKISAV
jgi:hypothetical protein